MKRDVSSSAHSHDHRPQTNSPRKKSARQDAEISLETLEILLTSVPEEEIVLSGCSLDEPLAEIKNLCVENVLKHKNHYYKRLQHLKKKKRGAEWLYRNLNYFQTKFPWELISLLENMAHTKNPDIICKTLKPINELRLQSSHDSPYQENLIGQISGLEILTTNIRRLIYNSLEEPLNNLSQDVIDQCNDDERAIWNNWSSQIEQHFNHIETLLIAGQRFFSVKNFRLMEQLPLSPRSVQLLKNRIDNTLSETA